MKPLRVGIFCANPPLRLNCKQTLWLLSQMSLRRPVMSKMSRILTLLLSAILVFGLGCARKAGDAQISSQIQSKFSQDSGLAAKQLTVQASSGVVTLSGFVDNDAQRQAAAGEAAAVEGVKEVVNNLEVGTASNAPASSSESQAQSEPAPAATEPVPF